MAGAGRGQPTPWQLGLQDAGSPMMADIIWFHIYVLGFITLITAFVLALMVIIMFRFNARANPTPSHTTHYKPIEVIWTIVPVIILVAMAIRSFRLLFTELDVPTPDLTVKTTGKQWYWSHAYRDNGNFGFGSLIVQEDFEAVPAE
jgi:cytochrome c oxidase subunit 2